MSTTPDEPELAPLPREEWRLEVDRQAAEKREENQRRGDEEQDPSLGAVDLDVIDAMYAEAAADGRADSAALDRATIAALESRPRRQGADRVRRVPTRDQRAIAAQRWEQNRRYVEERHRGIKQD